MGMNVSQMLSYHAAAYERALLKYHRGGDMSRAAQGDKVDHQAMANALPGHRNNGIKRRSFVSASAHMPSVLVELGVLSHRLEGKELAQDAHQAHLAMAVTEGIVNYFERN